MERGVAFVLVVDNWRFCQFYIAKERASFQGWSEDAQK
jgi:hypothetical protein